MEVLMTPILVPVSCWTVKNWRELEKRMVVEEKDWNMLRK
jgi:hypothetical protein